MSVIDTLITDRTEADVAFVTELNAKPLTEWTADELTAWMGGLKGAYNYTDLNRVSSAVQYVANELSAAGYELPTLTIKTDWTMTDKPTLTQLNAYLASVANIRTVIAVIAPSAPTSMQLLTYDDANNIEKILVAVEDSVKDIIAGLIYADEMQSAEAWE